MNYKSAFTDFLKNAGIYEEDDTSKSSIFKQPLNIWLDKIYAEWIQISRCRNVISLQIPSLVSKAAFEKELKHISKNFKTEVYTLENGYILKPTSELAVYNCNVIKKEVKSYSNLPRKYIIRNRVFRKESRTYPLVRHNEIFDFVETHEIYSQKANLELELNNIVKDYKKLCELFELNVIELQRFEDDRFSGSINTIALDVYLPGINKRLQVATAHNLHDNFSKVFDLTYKSELNAIENCLIISHGYSERLIGAILLANLDFEKCVLTLPLKLRLKELIIIDITELPILSHDIVWDSVTYIKKAQFKKTIEMCILRDSFVFLFGEVEKNNNVIMFYNRVEKQKMPLSFNFNEVFKLSTSSVKKDNIIIKKIDNLNKIIDDIPFMCDITYYNELKNLNLNSKIWGYSNNLIYFGPTF